MQTKLELYQLVAPLAGLGIWEWHPVAKQYYVNDLIRQILELPGDADLSPATILQLYRSPDDIRQFMQRAEQTRKPETMETALISAKGRERFVKIRIATVFDGDVCIQFYGTLEDITEEVRLRHLFQERERRFSEAFSYAPIGMALVSLKGEWLQVNESVCRLFGYPEAYFKGKTFQEFTYPDDLDIDLQQLQQLLSGQITRYSMEKRYFHRDGHLIWTLLHVSLVRDNDNQPLYFVSQIKDISDHKRDTGIIREQNSQLLNFAYIVSHNLRSHAGNMKMLAEMIADESDEAEKENLVKMQISNAGSLLQTLDHLNEVVMVRQDGPGEMTELNLNSAVEQTLRTLEIALKNVGGLAENQVDPFVYVQFRSAYLESVLLNLLTNSIKYRDPLRPLEITVSAERQYDKILLTVSDNGLGIDLVKHGGKLFGLYNTFHTGADARGMGLFLVKNQVEAMGGSISATSVPGQGAAFRVEMFAGA